MRSHKIAPQAVQGLRGEAKSISPPILPAAQPQLTTGQQQALDLLTPIFRGEQPGARATLQGYAGTGKTFLSARLVAAALASTPAAPSTTGAPWDDLELLGEQQEPSWRQKAQARPAVLLCGPTHKACRQIERALAGYGVQGIQAVTLHAALGLRPRREEDQQVFEPDSRARRLIGPWTRLVVVDEASMVGRELVDLLLAALPDAASLVAIGDPAQLQPVGDPGRSPLFDKPIQARLDQVVRHQGPILELATATRELGIGRPRFIARASDHSAVITHQGFGQWRAAAIRACRDAAREGNIDGARVLAWTNGAVTRFNADLHKILYGPSASPFVVGQPVVSHDAIPGPDELPLVSSTCVMEILAVEQEEGAVEGDELLEVREALLLKRRTKAGEKLPLWQWWNIEARLAGEGRIVQFQVLDPEHRASWNKACNAISKAAKAAKAKRAKKAAQPLWNLYWSRRDRFGQISPVWALTVHKSQGGTFERVFLHPDLDRHAHQGERNQLAYVGITRAARELHVIADRPPPPPGEDRAAAGRFALTASTAGPAADAVLAGGVP